MKMVDANLTPSDLSSVTGITVCYNTKDSMQRAYESIRRFCPDMPIIIIDGSDSDNPCASYVKILASDLTTVVLPGRNVGHGRGMVMGISQARTKYALTFDSDIEMLQPCVSAMLGMMEEDTFGIGYIKRLGFNGHTYKTKPQHRKEGWMLYLHPFFSLINIENYRKYHPYVHHGMPCYRTMLDIHNQGLSNEILKEFPDLINHANGLYVRHYRKVTRKTRRRMGLSGSHGIEGDWE